MPVKTEIDNTIGVMIRTVTGEITFEEIKSSYETSLTHPDFRKDMNVLWDVRDSDPSNFQSQEVVRIARYFEAQLKDRANYKVGVVVSRDLAYHLSKVYQVAAADLPPKIGIFWNFEEAKKWIMEED